MNDSSDTLLSPPRPDNLKWDWLTIIGVGLLVIGLLGMIVWITGQVDGNSKVRAIIKVSTMVVDDLDMQDILALPSNTEGSYQQLIVHDSVVDRLVMTHGITEGEISHTSTVQMWPRQSSSFSNTVTVDLNAIDTNLSQDVSQQGIATFSYTTFLGARIHRRELQVHFELNPHYTWISFEEGTFKQISSPAITNPLFFQGTLPSGNVLVYYKMLDETRYILHLVDVVSYQKL